MRITNDTSLAEDVVQETFIKAWRSLARFRTEANFRNWILSITHNTALDTLRKRRDMPFSAFDTDEGGNIIEDTTASPEEGADERLAREEDIARLEENIARLPPLQREVLTLYFSHHLTFREIGEITGESLHTVKSRHRRAITALRTMLTAPNTHYDT